MKRFRTIMKRVGQVGLLALCALIAVIGCNVWRFRSRQIDVAAVRVLELPEEIITARFASAIPIRTISEQNPARVPAKEFERFKMYLEESFPRVHGKLTRFTGVDTGDERNLSLLYKWTGEGDQTLPAVLLMAHYDVVAVELAALDRWTYPPFAGRVDDEYIWGRGTLDVKNGVMGLMEAAEYLLDQGFRPQRTIYISLGHDEEVGGLHGNKPISDWMRRHGTRLEFVLDEGGCIFKDLPGIARPVALIGVAEKGYLTVRLIVELKEGGHSSMPPRLTAIGVLSEALHRLHEHPFPQRLDGGVGGMLDFVGPEMPLAKRIAIGNRWLFSPLLKHQFGATPAGDASLRTTLAPTMTMSGVQENVLPTKAELILNCRILPGDTVNSTLDHIKNVIDDERVTILVQEPTRAPSRMSSTESEAFNLIHRTIKEVFPNVIVAPFVVVGGTDSSHFDDDSLSQDVYRFIPSKLDAADLKRIHGIDERISRQDYLNIVRFYIQLLKNATGN